MTIERLMTRHIKTINDNNDTAGIAGYACRQCKNRMNFNGEQKVP